MYYIWFDESDKEGEFYSNFYGGILIKSEHLEKVLQMMKCIVEEVRTLWRRSEMAKGKPIHIRQIYQTSGFRF